MTWDQKLKDQMSNLPEFDNIYRKLKRELKQVGYF